MARLNGPTGRDLVQDCLGLSFVVLAALFTWQPLHADSEPAARPQDRLLFTGAFRYTPPAAPDTDQIKQRIIAGPLAALQLAKEDEAGSIPPMGAGANSASETIEAAAPFKFFVLPASLVREPNPLFGQPSIGKIIEGDDAIVDEMREARLTVGSNQRFEALPQPPEAHPHRKSRLASASKSVTTAPKKKRTVRRYKHSRKWAKRSRKRRKITAIAAASTVYANANPWAHTAFIAKN